MPRPKPQPRQRQYQLTEVARRYLLGNLSTEELKEHYSTNPDYWECFFMQWPEPAGGYERRIWDEYREELLQEYTSHFPGYRPPAFWRWDAAEPRLRLGGVGEVDPGAGDLHMGLPVYWLTISAEEPPLFESQPVYLRRHDLFLEGEEARVDPDAWEPDIIVMDEDETATREKEAAEYEKWRRRNMNEKTDESEEPSC